MNAMPFRSLGLASVLTVLLANAALPGADSVTPTQPVFVPPLPTQTPLPPRTTPGEAPTASTGGAAAVQPGDTAAVETEQVAAASRAFSEAQFLCVRLPDQEYQIDCLSDQLSQYAESLPKTPEFNEARAIVNDAAVKLNRVARQNATPRKRRATLRESSGVAPKRSSRPIVPVAPEKLASATVEATAILREAETLLLRASQQSERRKVAYATIATAVGSSSLILLRAQ